MEPMKVVLTDCRVGIDTIMDFLIMEAYLLFGGHHRLIIPVSPGSTIRHIILEMLFDISLLKLLAFRFVV
jgi:hypothetical protein